MSPGILLTPRRSTGRARPGIEEPGWSIGPPWRSNWRSVARVENAWAEHRAPRADQRVPLATHRDAPAGHRGVYTERGWALAGRPEGSRDHRDALVAYRGRPDGAPGGAGGAKGRLRVSRKRRSRCFRTARRNIAPPSRRISRPRGIDRTCPPQSRSARRPIRRAPRPDGTVRRSAGQSARKPGSSRRHSSSSALGVATHRRPNATKRSLISISRCGSAPSPGRSAARRGSGRCMAFSCLLGRRDRQRCVTRAGWHRWG